MLKRHRITLILSLLMPLAAHAHTDPYVDLLAEPGSLGLGALARSEASPYKGGSSVTGAEPLYFFEGKYVYLHANRAGLKLPNTANHKFDVFLNYRFEGHPYDNLPTSLAGMETRKASYDAGLGYTYRTAWGNWDVEYMKDAGNINKGSEFRLGYSYDWRSGRWHFLPSVTYARRDANLNNYYYGVKTTEATATRAAYMPGAGNDLSFGLYGTYALSERWRLLGGIGATRHDAKITNSPIARGGVQSAASLGLAYDFGTQLGYDKPGQPLFVKALYGASSDCNLLPIMTLRCGSTNTVDKTRIASIEVGRLLAARPYDWPVEFVGYVGILNHDEKGLQANTWQVNGYVKVYYYGLPWSERVRTRLGFGTGFSLAERSPYVESRDQARRGRPTSRLLNYLDPSVDKSQGDMIGSRSLKDTVVGIGVSHRSGIFGSSRLLRNVDGGSNYIYTYVERKF